MRQGPVGGRNKSGAERGAFSRRGFLRAACGMAAGIALTPHALSASPPEVTPLAIPVADPDEAQVRAVTQKPGYHWFGYYDKHQLDPSDRYLLSMRVNFEHREPRPDDVIDIGMVDLEDDNRWIALGESRAWCWQQGCMLQWRPGFEEEVLWNDREGDSFVCRILNVNSRNMRTIPMAVNHVSWDGKKAVTTNYSRVHDMRDGYGYAGLEDSYEDDPAPSECGVWFIDLESGETERIVSLESIASISYAGASDNDKHRFYHCMWAPHGERFLFYNRWAGESSGTRVFTAAPDGSDVRLLSGQNASHYTWRDPENVLIWQQGAYRMFRDDGSGEPKETVWRAPNGHQTYVPDTDHEWVVTDTYPLGGDREQISYLFHIPSSRAIALGRFHAPAGYSGGSRCDLHPRLSRDGRTVIIDSPHGGNGRQQYIIGIGEIIDKT